MIIFPRMGSSCVHSSHFIHAFPLRLMCACKELGVSLTSNLRLCWREAWFGALFRQKWLREIRTNDDYWDYCRSRLMFQDQQQQSRGAEDKNGKARKWYGQATNSCWDFFRLKQQSKMQTFLTDYINCTSSKSQLLGITCVSRTSNTKQDANSMFRMHAIFDNFR